MDNSNQQNMNNMPMGMQPMSPEQYQAWYNQMMQMQQNVQRPPMQPVMQNPMMGQQQPMYPNNMYQPQMGVQNPSMNNLQMPQASNVTASGNYNLPYGNEPMLVNGQINPTMMQRDPAIVAYMSDAVREKNKGKQITEDFVQTEANKLYDDFGENLINTFERMLEKEQIDKFNEMLEGGATQNQLLEYTMGCIPNLEKRIEEVLLTFREKYINAF